MFWPIYIYLILSTATAVSAVFNASWSVGIFIITGSFFFLAAGGELKASLWWGDKVQKIGGCFIALLLVVLSQWLLSGFSVQLAGYHVSAVSWGWIGFVICFVFADKALAGCRQSVAAIGVQNNRQVTLRREKIIHEYGAFMDRTPPLPTRIKDVSMLPYPKEEILNALLYEIVNRKSPKIIDMMRIGAINLALFQPGLGNDRIELIGSDVTKLSLSNKHDAEVPRMHTKLIPAAENQVQERFCEFKELVMEDLDRINSMIAAASTISQKIREEQYVLSNEPV